MPIHIKGPTVIAAEGTKPKEIKEYVGRVNSGTHAASIARMNSPSGWVEPGQRPEFDEFSIVLRGMLQVEAEDGAVMEIRAGEGVIALKGEWVRYSTPGAGGAEYVAVCVPAFSPGAVHRDST